MSKLSGLRHLTRLEASEQTTDNKTGVGIYTVQKGDTLQTIANKYAVSIDELQAINKIANPDSIFVGQVLSIP